MWNLHAAVLFITIPAMASTITYSPLTQTVSISALPGSGASGPITYGGILNSANGGVNSVSSATGLPFNGTESFINSANGQTSLVSMTGRTSAATSAGGVTLGGQATMNLTNVTGGNYEISTNSAFNDQIDISGCALNMLCSFDFGFALTGTTTSSGLGRAFVDVYVILNQVHGSALSGPSSIWSGRFTGSATVSTSVPGQTLSLVRVNSSDTTALLSISVRAFALNNGPNNSLNSTADADFLHTLTLTSASMNSNGVTSSVVDTSGLTLGSSVPEPSSLALVSVSSILLCCVARRQRLSAQLVPGMIRGGAKPQTGRASRGKAAAKVVRTATKLSHRVTERYGAGY